MTIAEPQPSIEAPDATGIYRIWPGNGIPPGAEGWTQRESTMPVPWANIRRRLTRNVVIPTLTVFRPAPEKANGTAMIVAPGGAFHFLMIDHEGYDMARWLVARGVTAFVLKYRLGRTPDADADLADFRNDLQARLAKARNGDPSASPLTDEMRQWSEDDGRQAIRFVRENAAKWGINPRRVGIAGYSAGGGPAIGATLVHDAASRPDFTCGVYPAWRPELPMPADPPPLFLVISDDDNQVPSLSAIELYTRWRKAGAPAELHVFGNGSHGWGMAQEGFLSDPWTELFGNWLRARGLLTR